MKYFNDEPINSPLNDKLDYQHFAYYLAKSIAKLKTDTETNSYVIGLFGKWGDGKTSAINIALAYLKYLIKDTDESIYDINEKIKAKKLTNNITKLHKTIDAKINFEKVSFWLSSICIVLILLFLLILISNYFFEKFPQLTNSVKNSLMIITAVILFFLFFEKMAILVSKLLLSPVQIKEPIEKFKKDWKKLFKHEDFIEVRFDAWNFTNRETILKEFFKQLLAGIENQINANELRGIIKPLSNYSKLILNTDLSLLDNLFSQDEDINSLKDCISQKLEKNKKKIIIIIDDIDRLPPDEILLIFQTVRLIANFPNLIYILSFDKEQVCEAIKTKYGFDGKDYIEKIIQIEKNLPIIDNSILKKHFVDFIKKQSKDNNINADDIEKLYEFGLQGRYIKNFRDLYRFFNSFEFMYASFREENINVLDLAGITAIEVFEQPLYTFIRDNRDVFCSDTISILGEFQEYIYIKDGSTVNLTDFATELLKFKNIHIVSLLFSNLFIAIKENVNNYQRNINSNSIVLPEKISELGKSIDSKLTRIEKSYRRILNIAFIDNYFRHNLRYNVLTNDEKNQLYENFANLAEFKSSLMNLYEINPEKVIDFINYWNSGYNSIFRTKENVLLFIRNFLCLDENQRDLINFLHNENFSIRFLQNMFHVFNKDNPTDKISIKNVYDLITDNVKYLNNNLFFFVYIIYLHFRFPTDDPPVLNPEEAEYLKKIIALIKKDIKEIGIINDPHALYTLELLNNHLNCSDYVNEFIQNILNDGNENDLLTILKTDRYPSVMSFVKNIKKENELKNKLFDIKYNQKFSDLRLDQKFFVEDEYHQNIHLADVLIKSLIDSNEDIFAPIINDKNVNREIRPENIYEKIKDIPDNEISFMKEYIEDFRLFSQFIDIVEKMKRTYPDSYDQYAGKFDLFIN